MPDTFAFTREHAQKLDDIHEALVGNPLDPKAPPGLIATVLRHHVDLYGEKDSKIPGMKDDLVNVKTTQNEWKWKAAGVLAALGIVAEGLRYVFFRH